MTYSLVEFAAKLAIAWPKWKSRPGGSRRRVRDPCRINQSLVHDRAAATNLGFAKN